MPTARVPARSWPSQTAVSYFSSPPRSRPRAGHGGAIKYADPDRARAQLRCDSLLRDDGFEVVHFTWQQITQAPELVAASVRKAFRRGVRNAELRRPG
jgi:hypothetical protein